MEKQIIDVKKIHSELISSHQEYLGNTVYRPFLKEYLTSPKLQGNGIKAKIKHIILKRFYKLFLYFLSEVFEEQEKINLDLMTRVDRLEKLTDRNDL